MRALVADARAAGVERFHATMVAENARALALLKKVATVERVQLAAGEIDVVASVGETSHTLRRAA
jgi:hypothetical protein